MTESGRAPDEAAGPPSEEAKRSATDQAPGGEGREAARQGGDADPANPLHPGPAKPAEAPTEPKDALPEDAAARARRLLEDAIQKGRDEGTPHRAPGVRVDKYFGTDLPPVCASLGCYLTDDGRRFYCINQACQKHKQRLTKHNRRGNPEKDPLVYFRCPRCDARRIDMHVLSNQYVCRSCRYVWKR